MPQRVSEASHTMGGGQTPLLGKAHCERENWLLFCHSRDDFVSNIEFVFIDDFAVQTLQ